MKYMVLAMVCAGLLFGAMYDGCIDETDAMYQRLPVMGEQGDNPYGVVPHDPPAPLDESTLADPNDPTSDVFNYSGPVARALSRGDEGSSEWPGLDWYDDVLVADIRVGEGQDFDIDENTGHIYACFDTDHATLDSLIVYRSEDGGATWSFFGLCTNTDGSIINPKIRVVRDGSGNSWVVAMGIWVESGDDVLWTRRWTTTGASPTWEQVASDVNWADMDCEVGSGSYAIATYVYNGTDDVFAARNGVGGAGWVDEGLIYVNPMEMPYAAVACGYDGNAGIVFIESRNDGTPQIRFKQSSNSGASWAGSVQVSNAGSPLEDVDIALSPTSTEAGWITVTYEFADDRVGYYTSTNGGDSWAYQTIVPNAGDENLSSLRARKATGAVTMVYNEDPGDSVMFAWATASLPNDFTTPERVNDEAATGFWPACAGWNGSGFSAVLYCWWSGDYNPYFDWYGNTGLEETVTAMPDMVGNAPNPFNSQTNISFSLNQNSPVTISVYNMAGQLVTTLADGQSFGSGTHSVQWDGRTASGDAASPGVYFCRVNAGGNTASHRMLMVR